MTEGVWQRAEGQRGEQIQASLRVESSAFFFSKVKVFYPSLYFEQRGLDVDIMYKKLYSVSRRHGDMVTFILYFFLHFPISVIFKTFPRQKRHPGRPFIL